MRFPTLALGLATALAAPTFAHAERVDVPLRAGTFETGTVDAPGDVSTAAFLVLSGEKHNLSIKLKRAKKSELLPVVTVFDPDGNAFDIAAAGGKVKSKGTSFKAKLKDVPTAGLWRIEVRGADDTTGDYTVVVKSNDKASVKSNDVVPLGGAVPVEVRVGDGYTLTVAAKGSKGSSLIPDIQVVGPDGVIVPASVGAASVSTKKRTAKLKKFELPTFGDYQVRFVGVQGTGGGVSYSIKTALNKFKGDRPVADPGLAFAAEPGTIAALDASASTSPATVFWNQVGGPPVVLSDATSAHPTFTAPLEDASLAFSLAVRNAGLNSAPRLVVVEVAQRPIADAGASRTVAPGTAVVLDGSNSVDRRGQGLAYAWRVIEGSVALDDPTAATPSFGAPVTDGVLRLGLIVDDGRARSFESEQVIAVSATPVPVADAGREQFVGRMATVHLSGLASARAGALSVGTAEWTQVAGPTVELSDAASYFPSFTAPRQPADLMFELRIDGSQTTADRTSVRVRAPETNLPPVTVASGPHLAIAATVPVSANGSFDTDGDARSFRWAALLGPDAGVSDPDSADTNVTGNGDPTGLWVFAVQSRDALQYGAPELVRLNGPQYSGAPLAHAGANRTVSAKTATALDARASASTDGSDLTFAWRQISGTDWYDIAAEDTNFDTTAERPAFRLPADLSSLTPTRSMTFELVVTDANGTSVPDLVTLTFTGIPLNSAPVVTAETSALEPLAGSVVSLTGTASDRDGDPVTVTWQQLAGPSVNLSPSRNVLSPSFIAPADGQLVFELVGNDGFENGAGERVTINVNAKPVAVATVTPPDGPAGTLVTFDGSGSSDSEGADLGYTWTQVSGAPVAFQSDAVSFQAIAPVDGFTFRLVVNDGNQNSDPVQAAFDDETPPVPAPTANQTSAAYGASVTLSANPSDTEPATFAWRQINGSGTDPVVTLSSTTAQNPTFSVPVPGNTAFGSAPSATFGVIASRNGKDSVEKTVTVQFFASYNDTSLNNSERVYGIISQSCTSCHRGSNNSCPVGSGGNATGFGMATANAFSSNAIGANSCNSSKQRVLASNSGQSFLLDRMNGQGGSMPPSGLRPAAERNLIKDWIDQGAITTR